MAKFTKIFVSHHKSINVQKPQKSHRPVPLFRNNQTKQSPVIVPATIRPFENSAYYLMLLFVT